MKVTRKSCQSSCDKLDKLRLRRKLSKLQEEIYRTKNLKKSPLHVKLETELVEENNDLKPTKNKNYKCNKGEKSFMNSRAYMVTIYISITSITSAICEPWCVTGILLLLTPIWVSTKAKYGNIRFT